MESIVFRDIKHSVFEPSFHISPSVRLLFPSSLQTYVLFSSFRASGGKFPRVAGAPTSPARMLSAVWEETASRQCHDTRSPHSNGRPDYSLYDFQPSLSVLLRPKCNCFTGLGLLRRCCSPGASVVSSRTSVL
jgi:hypothetical protein